jgi:hypothetical protein
MSLRPSLIVTVDGPASTEHAVTDAPNSTVPLRLGVALTFSFLEFLFMRIKQESGHRMGELTEGASK